ncbi:ANTAR domain-containing protein [Streptomyces sp. NBC_00237]|uniref:ANTAR domain-containing protein n=1 Tax=Streptomyces sp. NBC_00237 TaxID=2975687 RepID=UPI002253F858|nr:ANTAR domain-containing protein [Streptomyces sp. NBC_00237]MCX5205547.1 ANTAR domain-containing protein [Streptomyces sp. NBC_00237]
MATKELNEPEAVQVPPGGGEAERTARPASARNTPPAQPPAALREELEHLRRELRAHQLTDMARGVVMAMTPCSPHQAWHILVEVSQHTGATLHTVAQRLVDSVQGPAPSQPIREALARACERVVAEQG